MKRLTRLMQLTPLALALLPATVWADTSSEIAELKARIAATYNVSQIKEAIAAAASVSVMRRSSFSRVSTVTAIVDSENKVMVRGAGLEPARP